MQLGRLQEVDLRQVWQGEASDFTPWLAQEENLRELGNTLHLDFELVAQEQYVGPYRADIVCQDTATGELILIENQLEKTDHSHLGQVLTYAAGLSAVTIVWIAKRFTEEHRAALDWLNSITDSDINLFGIEVKLYRIGNSPIAPMFDVISQPNDWTKVVRQSNRGGNISLTPTTQIQLEYWTAFRDYAEGQDSRVRLRKPYPAQWMDFSIGRAGIALAVLVDTRSNRIMTELDLRDNNAKAYFNLLLQEQEEIENEIGGKLWWNESPNTKRSNIRYIHENVDPTDRSDWERQHQMLFHDLNRFYDVFHERVSQLDANEYWETLDSDLDGGD